jgi:three-Cys-motif partner protein
MAIIDLHSKPFDEQTLTKLELFEDYAKEWIPTFVMSSHSEICVFDFFAGPGYDNYHVAGSPIRILRQVEAQMGHVFAKRVKVKLFFNEYGKSKFKLLELSCDKFIENSPEMSRAKKTGLLSVTYYNEDFAILFPKLLSTIKAFPSLIYIDQNGLRFLADQYLLELEKTETTDFLYYASSSFLLRFGNTLGFQHCLSLNIENIRTKKPKYVHQELLVQLREKLPIKTNLSLYPFTIKKNSNYYGIIFGASHPRAVDKFLKTVWKKNEINGAANFDIDDDKKKVQLDLFEGKHLTKIERFQEYFTELILSGQIKTNADAYNFVLKEGHVPQHAAEVMRKLKQAGVVTYDARQPLISYEKVYGREQRLLTYNVCKK